jgi:hypothetical protein
VLLGAACAGAGLGVPVVCVEPNKDRHQPVFWPLPEEKVRKPIGGDGLWTLDSRHVWDTVQAVRPQTVRG